MGFSVSGAASGASAGSAFGPWGTVIGGVAGAFLGKTKKPTPVDPANVDLAGSQKASIDANTSNFKGAASLSTMQNDYAQNESQRLLEKAIPGFGAIQQKLLSKVNEDLSSSGLSADVTANISRLAAERGISRGTSGGFNDFNLVRDFGFNLVDFENAKRARSLSTLQSVYGMAARVNPMTPMASFVTPGQSLQTSQFNEQSRYQEMVRRADGADASANHNASLIGGAGQIAGQVFGDWAAAKIKGGGKDPTAGNIGTD